MSAPPPLDDLLDKLGDQETTFLSRVRERVKTYVRGTGTECVSIVEKDGYGTGHPRTHHLGLDSYLLVLSCFLVKKNYKQHDLDSALTTPVSECVGKCYGEFLQENADLISGYFLQHMVKNDLILEVIMTQVVEKLAKKRVSQVRGKLVHVLVEGIKHAASSQLGHSIAVHVSAGVTSVAGTAIAHKLGPLLFKMMAVHLKATVAHILGSAVFKAAAHAAIKHCAYAAASAAFIHVVGAKVGIAHATMYLHVFGLAILGGILAHAVLTLPKELGEKISEGVVAVLREKFKGMNKENMEKVAFDIFSGEKFASSMAEEIAKSSEVEDAMKEFGDQLGAAAQQNSSWLFKW